MAARDKSSCGNAGEILAQECARREKKQFADHATRGREAGVPRIPVHGAPDEYKRHTWRRFTEILVKLTVSASSRCIQTDHGLLPN
jgi:hypothetical protein